MGRVKMTGLNYIVVISACIWVTNTLPYSAGYEDDSAESDEVDVPKAGVGSSGGGQWGSSSSWSQGAQHNAASLNTGVTQERPKPLIVAPKVDSVPTPGSGSASFVGHSSSNALKGSLSPQITKSVYVHIAPDMPAPPPVQIQAPAGSKSKHYNIVFVKTPSMPAPQVLLPQISSSNQEKTLIYVLQQNPEQPRVPTLQAPISAPPTKPEVFLIKYNGGDFGGTGGGGNIGQLSGSFDSVSELGAISNEVSGASSGGQTAAAIAINEGTGALAGGQTAAAIAVNEGTGALAGGQTTAAIAVNGGTGVSVDGHGAVASGAYQDYETSISLSQILSGGLSENSVTSGGQWGAVGGEQDVDDEGYGSYSGGLWLETTGDLNDLDDVGHDGGY